MSEQSIPDVRKHVTVPGTAEHCFRTFTERPLEWWPEHHVLLTEKRVAIAFEPGPDGDWVGGRYFETDVDGREIVWGRILSWDPPHGLSMTWRVNGRWQSVPDDERASEIHVSFTPVDEATTTVELAHVELHRHGEDAERILAALQGPSPGDTLANFARVV